MPQLYKLSSDTQKGNTHLTGEGGGAYESVEKERFVAKPSRRGYISQAIL